MLRLDRRREVQGRRVELHAPLFAAYGEILAAAQGLAAFELRDRTITQKYSFERKNAAFDAPTLRTFKANKPAWAFFTAQPPGYQKLMTFWVMSARQEETRLRRLATLAERSAKGERVR